MNIKHTPGPWHVKGGVPLVGIDRPYDIIAGTSLIAQTFIAPERSAAAANAALIAAAPDLLAALKQWAEYAKQNGGDEAYSFNAATRAAITRATGGNP
jgi:hypothetical protein